MSMKPCSECGKDVSTKAKNCPHCGAPAPSDGLSFLGWVMLVVGFVVLYGLYNSSTSDEKKLAVDSSKNGVEYLQTNPGAGGDDDPVATGSSQSDEPTNKLELIGEWSWGTTRGGGYVKAEGQVKNVSDQPMENVAALVEWKDENGNLITSETTLIEYDPIMPGQTSPWKVLARKNPAMEKAGLRFKKLFGSRISTKFD